MYSAGYAENTSGTLGQNMDCNGDAGLEDIATSQFEAQYLSIRLKFAAPLTQMVNVRETLVS